MSLYSRKGETEPDNKILPPGRSNALHCLAPIRSLQPGLDRRHGASGAFGLYFIGHYLS